MIFRRARGGICSKSWPLKRISSARTLPGASINPITASIATLFPEPDSPSIPTTSPCTILRCILSTTGGPPKSTVRFFRTSKGASFIEFVLISDPARRAAQHREHCSREPSRESQFRAWSQSTRRYPYNRARSRASSPTRRAAAARRCQENPTRPHPERRLKSRASPARSTARRSWAALVKTSAVGCRARNARCNHIFLLQLAERGAAHQPHISRQAAQCNRKHHIHQARPKNRNHRNRQQQGRQCSRTSVKRMISVSSQAKNAAARPSTVPRKSAMNTEMALIQKDRRAPYINRDNISRPASSVPSAKRHEPPAYQAGGSLTTSRYCSIGLCGASSGAQIAHRRIAASASNAPRCAREPWEPIQKL